MKDQPPEYFATLLEPQPMNDLWLEDQDDITTNAVEKIENKLSIVQAAFNSFCTQTADNRVELQQMEQ